MGTAGGLGFAVARPECWDRGKAVSISTAPVADTTGIASKDVGDSDFGGGGNGLLRCVVFPSDAGDDLSTADGTVAFRSGGDEDKLSNEIVWGIFDLTSFP